MNNFSKPIYPAIVLDSKKTNEFLSKKKRSTSDAMKRIEKRIQKGKQFAQRNI